MRSGVCIVQQALTDEVASVLKLSVNLARRRGHAQVTPLHVAAIVISTSSASTDVLRRACLKSQPHHPTTHPLRCRALELCFNVALNRLPTTAPPSSASLLPSPSSLSNSLIAALKRAQANQRRGGIELQQLQQQPLFAIKVEMEQLMLSILDDPSVSRVMKEAGFSSSFVKSNLEEEASTLNQSSPFLLDSSKDITNASREMWQSPLLGLASKVSVSEDLTSVIGTMISKQGRKDNTVVVGDSISMTEGLVDELKRRLERYEVPDELMHAGFINLQFSVHPRLMSQGEVDMKMADLRKAINSLTSYTVGLIIYAGDLSWAVNEEPIDGSGFNYDPVEHIVVEMGNIFSEFKSSMNNRVWLLATASYSTYTKCLIRQPCLVTLWALKAVVVPSGWLGLGLQASSCLNSKVSTFAESPFQLLQSKIFSSKPQEKLLCCDECTFNFEKEASVFKSEIPCWLQANPESNQKEALPELNSGWPNSMFCNQNKTLIESQSLSFPSTIQNVYTEEVLKREGCQ
ncbi:protein SMAX1-LIKE 5-like [Zingiber officinale]|uniref:protein SMAX1-LIKE 5-like n=1 Tax=Zingiber officinale TaxID=94328 RepID=UPI001C4CB196|nr:protein SMAX1-LIKE 5-like [Zingiber officinale]